MVFKSAFFCAAFAAPCLLCAAVSLPPLIGEHMVLQADTRAALWGSCVPNATVCARFVSETGETLARMEARADAEGTFRGKLDVPLEAGIRGELIFEDGEGETRVSDVLTGEVWLAAGQSNMGYSVGAREWPAHVTEQARREVARYAPKLRYFNVPREGADAPQNVCGGAWVVADAASVRHCSAVAWNFAVAVCAATERPVGIVLSSIGGTPIDAWMPREGLDRVPCAAAIRARHENALKRYPQNKAAFDRAWKAWVEKYPSKAAQTKVWASRPREPYGPTHPAVPSRLYNGMVAPVTPFSVRGIIWYQGENDIARADEYAQLFPEMVRSWRAAFGAQLPFYYVELANFKARQNQPVDVAWPPIREAQENVLRLPATGVACAHDVGEANQIHYWNKKPVGERLAGMALTDVYRLKNLGETRSPELASFRFEDGYAALKFAHTGGKLRLRPNADIPNGFALRGDDGIWHWADETRIEGDCIYLRAQAVPRPTAARYAWAQNPLIAVENATGLPLRPFRTDK